MAAISSIIAGVSAAVGVGTSLYGASQKQAGDKAAQEAAAKQAALEAQRVQISNQQTQLQNQYTIQQSDLSRTYAGQELGLNKEASDISVAASEQSYGLSRQSYDLQRTQDAVRAQAMETDARRKNMENLRQTQRARSLALASGAAAGSQFGSATGGAKGQISGQSGVNALGVNQALYQGRQMFALNAGLSSIGLQGNELDLNLAKQRAALQTREAQMKYQYADTQATNLTDYTTKNSAFQTQFANLGGQINTNQGQIAAGQGQAAFGSSLFAAGPTIFSMGEKVGNLAPSLFGTNNASQANFSLGTPTSANAIY